MRPPDTRAYPRWRGGNCVKSFAMTPCRGLSPLARGKPRGRRRHARASGPIPAGAGETRHRRWPRPKTKAYPRWRGGNSEVRKYGSGVWGLSPLARGKLLVHCMERAVRGPIPAGAGETPRPAPPRPRFRAYPRWRGGNIQAQVVSLWGQGLSPLARGKRFPSPVFARRTGPIPAGAGETRGKAVEEARRRAYPRWRGGNGVSA